jgi:hypothetical protein
MLRGVFGAVLLLLAATWVPGLLGVVLGVDVPGTAVPVAFAADPPPADPSASAASLVDLDVRYVLPEAGAVAMTWGVNGWQLPPPAMRPPGTTEENGVLSTPMVRQGGAFVSRLAVPAGTTVDAIFNIQETAGGRTVDIWDTRPRSALAGASGASTSIFVAGLLARGKVYTSALDPQLHWPIVVLFALALGTMFLPRRVTLWADRLAGLRHVGLALLVAIVLVGAGLRLVAVQKPLVDFASWRQSSTAMMAQQYAYHHGNIFLPALSWNGPDLSYQGRELQTISYLTGMAWKVVGQRESVGRLIATLFGLWGIVALYLLVRRVWDEPRALASAATMAVLPGSIYVEQSFLPDPAMVALMTTCAWLLARYLHTRARRTLMLAAIVGAWGACSKLPGLIVGLPACYAVIATFGPPSVATIRQYRPLLLAAIGVLAPTVAYYGWAWHLSLTYPPYHFAGQDNWLWDVGLDRWLAGGYFWSELSWHFSAWLWTMPAVVLVALGLVLPPPRQPDAAGPAPRADRARSRPDVRWFFHWWVLGFAVFYAIGAQELIKNGWNFHLLNPPAAALIGHAAVSATALATGWRAPVPVLTRVLVPALLVLTIALVGQVKLLTTVAEPVAWSGYQFGLALRRISQPGDLVVTLAATPGDPVAVYYSRRRGWVFPPDEGDGASHRLPTDDQQMIRQFEALRGQDARWFGLSKKLDEDSWDNHVVLRAHIDRTCTVVEQTDAWMVCRILTPAEVALLDAAESPTAGALPSSRP